MWIFYVKGHSDNLNNFISFGILYVLESPILIKEMAIAHGLNFSTHMENMLGSPLKLFLYVRVQESSLCEKSTYKAKWRSITYECMISFLIFPPVFGVWSFVNSTRELSYNCWLKHIMLMVGGGVNVALSTTDELGLMYECVRGSRCVRFF